MKITVAGAGFYGSTLAERIAERGYADEVVLTDIVEGRPQGLALDIMQSGPLEGFDTRVVGTNGYGETAGSEVCVITAGVARKPGMSRTDLLETNARIVADVTRRLVEASPDTVLIVVSNPLDEMTALAAFVSGLPPARVMGQAGVLDSARFRHFLAERLSVPSTRVEALTLGSHGDTMVPVPSLARVAGRPLDQLLDPAAIAEVVQRTRDGGAEIVGLLKTGSAYFAPSSAAEVMVRAVVGGRGAALPVSAETQNRYGIETATSEVLPVSAWTEGQYGIDGVYLGVPARLGPGGVEEVVQLALADDELSALRAAAESVRSKQVEVRALAGL